MNSPLVRNYVGGSWHDADGSGTLPVENPSTRETLGQVTLSTPAEAAAAVDAASAAFPAWRATPVTKRTTYLFELLHLLRHNGEDIARTLTEEMGKSLPDARAEMQRVYQNIEVACGASMLQQGDKLTDCAAGIDGEVLRMPRGVFAAVTPFNFPAMAPFWFIPYAIATGNTFILKPSELVPLTMQRITEYIHETGLPPGVFNLVNGGRAAAEALVDHPDVAGISLVGKSSTCKAVAQRCAARNKRFQAMGGAKNHLVVMPDCAHADKLLRNMITSCYGCAGQRCMAASVIVAVGEEMYDTVTRGFVDASKTFVVANPLDPAMADEDVLMGPLISGAARRLVHEMVEEGVRAGATLALDGRDVSVPGCENGYFVGPTVFTDVTPDMSIYQTEIFAPVVCIMKAASLDEALELIRNHPYGNAASIYTQDGYQARRFKLEADCGMIGVNVGIPAPVPFLPFGGTKESMLCETKMQGASAIEFYTERKVIVERYWE